jgi:hypothetical protein
LMVNMEHVSKSSAACAAAESPDCSRLCCTQPTWLMHSAYQCVHVRGSSRLLLHFGSYFEAVQLRPQ